MLVCYVTSFTPNLNDNHPPVATPLYYTILYPLIQLDYKPLSCGLLIPPMPPEFQLDYC